MIKTIHPKGVELLVRGIVGQARRDFLESSPGSETRKEVERFFLSHHFGVMTGLDGHEVLKQLNAEYEKNPKKRRKRDDDLW